MPVYRIFRNGSFTGGIVMGSDYADAYFNAASELMLRYDNDIELEEVPDSGEI